MATTLEVKVRTGAAAYAPLTALLGSSPFRWFDTQLPQGATFPAVVAQLISNPQNYYMGGQMDTSFARLQLTVWDTDAERARAVEAAISSFLQQFTASGAPAGRAKPNYIMNTRQSMYPQTQPPQFQRIIDAKLFDNSTL
jgi:hypothetical protein